MEVSIDPRILNKVLLICQKNSTKLDQISKRQDEMQPMMVEQREMIAEQKDKIDQNLKCRTMQITRWLRIKGRKLKTNFIK